MTPAQSRWQTLVDKFSVWTDEEAYKGPAKRRKMSQPSLSLTPIPPVRNLPTGNTHDTTTYSWATIGDIDGSNRAPFLLGPPRAYGQGRRRYSSSDDQVVDIGLGVEEIKNIHKNNRDLHHQLWRTSRYYREWIRWLYHRGG